MMYGSDGLGIAADESVPVDGGGSKSEYYWHAEVVYGSLKP